MRGRAEAGPAEEPRSQSRLGPPPARPGSGATRLVGSGADGSAGQASRAAPAGQRQGRRREGGSVPLKARSPLGLWGPGRARPGARSGGGAGGGGATAAPPEAKFEKRTRFPPFFKPKNKTFFPVCFTLGTPTASSRPVSSGCADHRRGGSSALPPRHGVEARGPCPGRLVPPCGRAAAPRATPGAPQRHVGGRRLPPPVSRPCPSARPWRWPRAPGLSPRAAPRPAAARFPLAGAARSAAADSSPRGRAADPLPLLKRATAAAATTRPAIGGLHPARARCGLCGRPRAIRPRSPRHARVVRRLRVRGGLGFLDPLRRVGAADPSAGEWRSLA